MDDRRRHPLIVLIAARLIVTALTVSHRDDAPVRQARNAVPSSWRQISTAALIFSFVPFVTQVGIHAGSRRRPARVAQRYGTEGA
jgi:hypothetical protein